jgi:Sugar kinases, ribokinase family
MNAAEAKALTGASPACPAEWPAILRGVGLGGGIVTGGSGPIVAFEGEAAAMLTPPHLDIVADVTGAGDATAAGFLSAWLRGTPLTEALREGVAAALITLETPSATAAALSPDALKSHLPLVPVAKMLS